VLFIQLDRSITHHVGGGADEQAVQENEAPDGQHNTNAMDSCGASHRPHVMPWTTQTRTVALEVAALRGMVSFSYKTFISILIEINMI
jgi:hypothetical protein